MLFDVIVNDDSVSNLIIVELSDVSGAVPRRRTVQRLEQIMRRPSGLTRMVACDIVTIFDISSNWRIVEAVWDAECCST